MSRGIALLAAVALAVFAFVAGCGISPSRPEAAATPPGPPIAIEVLADEESRELEDCGCAFYPRGRRAGSNPVIGWTGNDAPLRLDGATQRLVLREQRETPTRDQPVVGDRADFRFDNDRTRATLSCRVSATCWEDESCESIGYQCGLDVESGGRRGARDLEGYCGC